MLACVIFVLTVHHGVLTATDVRGIMHRWRPWAASLHVSHEKTDTARAYADALDAVRKSNAIGLVQSHPSRGLSVAVVHRTGNRISVAAVLTSAEREKVLDDMFLWYYSSFPDGSFVYQL